jgi:hypothetical protein
MTGIKTITTIDLSDGDLKFRFHVHPGLKVSSICISTTESAGTTYNL